MVKVLFTQRKSAVLAPSKMGCLAGMPTINLTAGCAHGCLYCYAQGYRTWPGKGKIRLYDNTLVKLQNELARKRKKPAAVCLSSSSDLFQPVPEVLVLALDVLKTLFQSRIVAVFLTKGVIPPPHMELLRANASLVRAQIGITTLDEKLVQLFEPCAAPPHVRLAQLAELTQSGIATQARVDPILPELTDGPDTLHPLCAALAEAGVKEIAASTLFLRPAILRALQKQQGRRAAIRKLLRAYLRRDWLRISGSRGLIMALPAARRREIFDRLTIIARHYGISVRPCGCKNPDLAVGTCNAAGSWTPITAGQQQLNLFALDGPAAPPLSSSSSVVPG